MEGTSISWSEAFDSHSQLFPSSAFPAEALDSIDSDANATSLTYTTLESVKLTPLEPLRVPGPHRRETPEQPIDLTLNRQVDFADISNFKPPQVSGQNYLHFR